MPLGIPIGIGRYSEHVKISTESDDAGLAEAENEPCPVRFIGQQNVPLYNSKNVSGMMYQIYNKNYSPINSLINLKKYELNVDTTGISVFLAASKKGTTRNLFMNYSLTDILLVTTDYQHDRLFAIIFYGPLRNCVLHLYLCNSDDDVRVIMNKCNEEFSNNKEIKQIEKSAYSEGLEIIHYKPYERAKEMDDEEEKDKDISEIPKQNNTYRYEPEQIKPKPAPMVDIRDFKIPYHADKPPTKEFVKDDSGSFNFGEFQSSTVVKTNVKATVKSSLPNSPKKLDDVQPTHNPSVTSVNLMDEDDFEDEFAELALKRNVYIPNHLQDKSIESSLLFPDDLSQQSNGQNAKPGFFSSYNKLQS